MPVASTCIALTELLCQVLSVGEDRKSSLIIIIRLLTTLSNPLLLFHVPLLLFHVSFCCVALSTSAGEPSILCGMFFTTDHPFEDLFVNSIQLFNKTWKEMRATSADFLKVLKHSLKSQNVNYDHLFCNLYFDCCYTCIYFR